MANKFPSLQSILFSLALAAIGASFGSAAHAQTPARITQSIDESVLVRVPRSTHPLAKAVNDRGRLNADAWLDRMVLVLKPGDTQQAAVKKLLDSQHDKQSASFHRWLTPDEYGAQFGVGDSDLNKITNWLAQNGFQVGAIARGRQWIEFSGTATQVERTFHTEMHNYLVNGEKRVANAKGIALPQALAPVVSGILSLHNFPKQGNHGVQTHVHRDATGHLVPGFTISNINGTFHYLSPGDYKKIYNTQPLLDAGIDGSGLSIAIVGRTDIFLSDVQMFRKTFGLPTNDPVFIVNGADPGLNQDVTESDLDVQWAGALAPNASIKFVTSASTLTTDGVDLSMSYIVDNLVAPIMSTSYSACEAFLGTAENAHLTSLLQQAAAEGITAFVSSGDNGPAGCDPSGFNPAPALNGPNVSGLATTHYTTTVGGTQFNENGQDATYWLKDNRSDFSSAIGYIPEIVWDESCDPTVDPNQCFGTQSYISLASGGGPSNCSLSTNDGQVITCLAGTPKPSWQAGIGVPNDGVRDIPDLSLAAAAGHDGYVVCDLGSCETDDSGNLINFDIIGGTSAGTPAMAGIMALLEQKNGAYQGMANYSLYQLASAEKLAGCNSSKILNPNNPRGCVFYDVTAGNNSVPGQVGYSAGKGYDLTTGLGSINAANLVNAWSSAQKLASVTAVRAGAASIEHGQTLPLNVLVTPASGTGAPSGDFSLVTDKYGAVMGGTLTNGVFSGGVNDLPGGTYHFKARYGGDAMFAGSDSSDLAVKVTPEDSVLDVTAWYQFPDGSPLPLNQPILYDWSLSLQLDAHGKSNVGAATGNATITLDTNTKLGTFPLNEKGNAWVEVAHIQRSGLLPGKHVFSVTYSGDNSFRPAGPVQIPATVVKGRAFFAVYSSQETITEGSALLLKVNGSGGFSQPTGTVDIYDNGKKIAGPTAIKDDGMQGHGFPQATYVLQLNPGVHSFGVSYSGDSNYEHLPPGRHAFQVTVNRRNGAVPKIHVQQTPGAVKIGDSVHYVVTVAPTKPGGPTPTGQVDLLVDTGNSTGQVYSVPPNPLSNGVATFDVPWYFAGTYLVIAEYSGDSVYSQQNGAIATVQVKPATPTVTVSAPAPVLPANQQTSLSVTVVGQPQNTNVTLPFGPVQFYDSFNGGPEHLLGRQQLLDFGNGNFMILTIPVTLPVGTHVIRAEYLGQDPGGLEDWNAASSNLLTVQVQ
jgi:large repetitive protein